MIKLFGFFFAVILLSQCATAKQMGTAMSDFFKAIGSGDTSILDKFKKHKDKEAEWEEVK